MKALWQSLKSLYGVVSLLTLIFGSFGTFGISVIIPSASPWVSVVIFAVSFVAGFLYGSFGADKRAEIETKTAYETERARVETEAAEKRRDLAIAAAAEKKAKDDQRNQSFRREVKTLDFYDKVLLWHVYEVGEYTTWQGAQFQDICDILDDLTEAEYVETETVDFGSTAYCVTDETRSLIERNEDLFRNARKIGEDELMRRMF